MKNPMIENNINADLFEAINENEVNGGAIGGGIVQKPTILKGCIKPTKGVVCPIVRSFLGICPIYR